MRRKLYLETFGCQMNVLDSELVLGQLRARDINRSKTATRRMSFSTTPARSASMPSRKSGRGSANCATAKAGDPELVIGVIGCMAERDGVNIFRRYPHVDILCGPGELDKLAALVHNAAVTSRRKLARARPP